jgi:hypothetical protein
MSKFTINPLDVPGTLFQVELLNPNPTSSRKGYRISFQVSEEVHSAFMAAKESNLRIVAKMAVVGDTDEQEAHEAVNGSQVGKTEKPQRKPKAAKEPTPYGQLWRYLHLDGFFAAPGIRESLAEVRESDGDDPHTLMRKVFDVASLSNEVGAGEIYNKFPPDEYPAVKVMVEQALRKAAKQ